jgi:hypothetical protein
MAEIERTEDQPGVFGNLPRSRPAHRSPRRQRPQSGRAPAAAATPEEATGRARIRPRRSRPQAQARPDEPQAIGAHDQPAESPGPEGPAESDRPEGEANGGLEELAWAGIAVAAEAATLGVRLAGRAFERARDAVERR